MSREARNGCGTKRGHPPLTTRGAGLRQTARSVTGARGPADCLPYSAVCRSGPKGSPRPIIGMGRGVVAGLGDYRTEEL
jgi:hypothetical protein